MFLSISVSLFFVDVDFDVNVFWGGANFNVSLLISGRAISSKILTYICYAFMLQHRTKNINTLKTRWEEFW